jgi:hypothetical protein
VNTRRVPQVSLLRPGILATDPNWKLYPPLCHPERTRVSYFTALNSNAYVVLPKENHMQLAEAATLDRKSGEAEGSAVSLHPEQMFRPWTPTIFPSLSDPKQQLQLENQRIRST